MANRKCSFPYLFWRGNTLWSRCPWPDKPTGTRYSMNLTSNGTVSDMAEQELKAVKLGYRPFNPDKPEQLLFDISGSGLELSQSPRPTYRDIAEIYLREYVDNLPKKQTRYCFSSSVRQTIKFFGDSPAEDIQPQDVQLWINQLRREGKQVATIRTYRWALQSVFNFARFNLPPDRRITCGNPIDGLKSIVGQKLPSANVRTHYVPRENLEKYLAWFRENYPAFSLLYQCMMETGRRPTELAALTWEQLSTRTLPSGRNIYVFSVNSDQTKNHQTDEFFISDDLYKRIKQCAWRTGLVFRNPHALLQEGAWSPICWQNRINALKKAYPDDHILQKMWPRDTRRAFITYKSEYGPEDELQPLEIVGRIVGQTSLKTTERYRVKNPERTLKALFPDEYSKHPEARNGTTD